MAHPQSSPRGFIAHKRIDVGSSNITYNSTGVVLSGALYLSGKSTVKLSANSTAVNATALSVGSLASYITANSTGIKIGSRYISTNTTGNSTT